MIHTIYEVAKNPQVFSKNSPINTEQRGAKNYTFIRLKIAKNDLSQQIKSVGRLMISNK